MNFVSHCKKCSANQICGKWHVYVIEYKKDVLNESKFKDRNPHVSYPYKNKCYYVGITKDHSPECRYKQHVRKRRKKKKSHIICRCKGNDIKLELTPYNGSGKFVQKYHKPNGLRSEKYRRYNPLKASTREEAEAIEKELADDLMNDGHAVWFN